MLYLKDEVYFEPLFNDWYAWAHLLSPITSCRHVIHTHRRIMRSFIHNTDLHILAAKEPMLAGGEFLDCPKDKIDVIQQMVHRIDEYFNDCNEFCSAVEKLDQLVASHPEGRSVEYIYGQLPQPLKGYVELTMDVNFALTYRFIEALLYDSKYYKEDCQSIRLGMTSLVNERAFALSTPRLPDQNHIHVDLELRDELIDLLFRAREVPLAQQDISRIFNARSTRGGLPVDRLFTKEVSEARHRKTNKALRLQYTGHAGFLIETANQSILIDPLIAPRASGSQEMMGFNELPEKIDYVFITHCHADHFNLETLLQLRYKINTVVVPRNNGGGSADPSMRLLLERLHFKVKELDDLEKIDLLDGYAQALPFFGEHGDLSIRSKTTWFFRIAGCSLYFCADATNIDDALYTHLARHTGSVDLLAIGMECVGAPFTWIYGALHTRPVSKEARTERRLNGSDAKQAMNLIRTLSARKVFLYALGREPCYRYLMGGAYSDDSKQVKETSKVVEECNKIGVDAKCLYARETVEYD